ncbi:histidine phosphatase family protein [Noviherbaspirillum pedocola]|nr:histidine phosphatase family protein [Noviherbaspirillum pedocola]
MNAAWLRRIVGTLCAWALLAAGLARAADGNADDEALWRALRDGGQLVLMRHASAPGVGDPPGFRIDDCATQRNLSEQGRREATEAGERFHRHGVTRADIYSSLWCRCLETARLLGLGPVTPLPALNSFFENDKREAEQTAQLRALISAHPAQRNLVLVTHQVNITALTGVFPESGEMLVLRPRGGKLQLLGRIRAGR